MAQSTLSPIEQALRLVGTPLALETLSDLAHDRLVPAGDAKRSKAIEILFELGAVENSEPGTLTITRQGRELCFRLEEIELDAAKLLKPFDLDA